jgi:hypothetical protein
VLFCSCPLFSPTPVRYTTVMQPQQPNWLQQRPIPPEPLGWCQLNQEIVKNLKFKPSSLLSFGSDEISLVAQEGLAIVAAVLWKKHPNEPVIIG